MPKPAPEPVFCDVLPPLPCGSIEVDVMCAALKAGKTGEEAIAAALVVPAEPELPIDPETPAPSPAT